VTRLEEIAVWASGLRLEDVPEPVLARARLQQDNTVAAARAGETAEGVGKLHAAARDQSPAADAYRNAAASIAHDWDDYLYMGHTGHSAVWASRAVGDAEGADDDAVLRAQIAANEVSGRLGAALFLGPHNGQFWSTIHCPGAALAAGLLLGLEPDRLAHAMAISLYQPPYGLWPGFMGPDTKLLTAAEPLAQGIRAADLAAEGFTGPLDVIESPRGLLAHLAFAPRPSMLEAFGEVWLTDTLAFKPYPGCAYLQAAVEAILRLGDEHGLEAADVEGVDVEGGYLTTGMEELAAGPDLTAIRVNFSVALSAAVALIAGRLTHEELTLTWLREHEPAVRDLVNRVRLTHDWGLTLETIRGSADALPLAAATRDVPVRRWLALPRRMRETGMDELSLGFSDLKELARRPEVRQAVAGAIRGMGTGDGGGPRGLAALDTSRLRMTFPARVRVRTREGRLLEAEGREPGSCGRPLDEQQRVVDEKKALIESAGKCAPSPAGGRNRATVSDGL
jgi:2-methylcitrate dehydratase PrpD